MKMECFSSPYFYLDCDVVGLKNHVAQLANFLACESLSLHPRTETDRFGCRVCHVLVMVAEL